MISTNADVAGKAYKELIEFACEKSDAVSLVYNDYGRPVKKHIRSLRDMMKPYLLHSKNNRKLKEGEVFSWPGTETWDISSSICVNFYSINPPIKDVLLSVDSIFSWVYPEQPEDMSFYKNGSCWLYTVAHEMILVITDHEEEISRMFDNNAVDYEMQRTGIGENYIERY